MGKSLSASVLLMSYSDFCHAKFMSRNRKSELTPSFAISHFTLYLPPYLLRREAMGISPIFHGVLCGGLLVFCMWLIIMNMIFGGHFS